MKYIRACFNEICFHFYNWDNLMSESDQIELIRGDFYDGLAYGLEFGVVEFLFCNEENMYD